MDGSVKKVVPPKFWPISRESWVRAVNKEREVLNAAPGSLQKPLPYPGLRGTVDSKYLGQDTAPKDQTTYRLFCSDWGEGPLSWATADGFSCADYSVESLASVRTASEPASSRISVSRSSRISKAGLSSVQLQRVADAARDATQALVESHSTARRRGWSG